MPQGHGEVEKFRLTCAVLSRYGLELDGGHSRMWPLSCEAGAPFSGVSQMPAVALGPQFVVNAYTAESSTALSLTALSTGGFVIGWQDESGTGVPVGSQDDVRFARYDGFGTRQSAGIDTPRQHHHRSGPIRGRCRGLRRRQVCHGVDRLERDSARLRQPRGARAGLQRQRNEVGQRIHRQQHLRETARPSRPLPS